MDNDGFSIFAFKKYTYMYVVCEEKSFVSEMRERERERNIISKWNKFRDIFSKISEISPKSERKSGEKTTSRRFSERVRSGDDHRRAPFSISSSLAVKGEGEIIS